MDLTCPITSEKFNHPVIASDGHTYEKKAILQWFETSNISLALQESTALSPCTGLRLPYLNVIPNHIVSKIIDTENARLKKMALMIDILWLYINTLETDEQMQIIQYAKENIEKDYDEKDLIKYIKRVYQFVCDAYTYCNINKKQMWFSLVKKNTLDISPTDWFMDNFKMLVLFYVPTHMRRIHEHIVQLLQEMPKYENKIYEILDEIEIEFDIKLKISKPITYKCLTYRISQYKMESYQEFTPPIHITNLCKEIELNSKKAHQSLRFIHAGFAEVDLYIKNKCHTLTCTNIQATILCSISQYEFECSYYRLAKLMNIKSRILAIELSGIIKCGLILSDIPISYTDILKINMDYDGIITNIPQMPDDNYVKITSEMYDMYKYDVTRFIKWQRVVSYYAIRNYVKCEKEILDIILQKLIDEEIICKKTNRVYEYLF